MIFSLNNFLAGYQIEVGDPTHTSGRLSFGRLVSVSRSTYQHYVLVLYHGRHVRCNCIET